MNVAPNIVTAPHPPTDPASIGSHTEVKRWITRTVDRDCGERYVNMDEIITAIIWSPPYTTVSYDLANLNRFIVVGAKYHMFAHTVPCRLQDIEYTDGEKPEHGWWKVQCAVAKL